MSAEPPRPRALLKRALDKSAELLQHPDGVRGGVREELARLLERVDVQRELRALASRFVIEVTTEVRLTPSEDAPFGFKPQVTARAQLKRAPAAPEADTSPPPPTQEEPR
ncbi:MAG: hypothetical protein FJ138_07185 [Deltaproteobacteria bacterium]|nr:hypothetical protein [Deltaproteobacteria bacterium]